MYVIEIVLRQFSVNTYKIQNVHITRYFNKIK